MSKSVKDCVNGTHVTYEEIANYVRITRCDDYSMADATFCNAFYSRMKNCGECMKMYHRLELIYAATGVDVYDSVVIDGIIRQAEEDGEERQALPAMPQQKVDKDGLRQKVVLFFHDLVQFNKYSVPAVARGGFPLAAVTKAAPGNADTGSDIEYELIKTGSDKGKYKVTIKKPNYIEAVCPVDAFKGTNYTLGIWNEKKGAQDGEYIPFKEFRNECVYKAVTDLLDIGVYHMEIMEEINE